jgi:ubiquitin-conjugating enzyme E2 J2
MAALVLLSGLLHQVGLAWGAGSSSSSSQQVRRITGEWKDVKRMGLQMSCGSGSTVVGNGTELVRLMPLERNIFEWHFTFAGPPDSPYEGGLYHGRIVLPKNYPLSPPSVQLLTPNGRFAEGASICLSLTNYHSEQWNPACTVLTLVTALRSHMLEPAMEIGAIRTTPSVKRLRAFQSRSWRCRSCNCNHKSFPAEQFSLPPGKESDFADLLKDVEAHERGRERQSGSARRERTVARGRAGRVSAKSSPWGRILFNARVWAFLLAIAGLLMNIVQQQQAR